MDKKLCSYIDGHKKEFVSDLISLVNIKSVREEPLPGKPYGEGPARAVKKAEEILSAHGFTAVNYENHALEADLGKNPVLGVLCHLDVVEEGENWSKKPYDAVCENGLIYGRGTTDDKGAAVAVIYALKALKSIYGVPEKGARLVLGSAEETGSEDMDYYFSHRPALKYNLSPDADYPLINLEKGRYAPVFCKNITVQPNEKQRLISITGGTVMNIVPGKAAGVVSGFTENEITAAVEAAEAETKASFSLTQTRDGNTEITVFGKTSHAANPHKGNNAGTALVNCLCRLFNDSGEAAETLRYLQHMFPHSQTDGTAAGVKMSDEKSGALTLNFGVLSFFDGVFTVGLDLRVPLCADDENVCRVLCTAFSQAGFENGGEKMSGVHYVPEEAPVVKEALRVYEDYTGLKGECLSIGGGTYVHNVEGGIAFGIEFGGRDYRIHAADEYAVIDELLLTAKMYAQIIKDMCY